MNEGGDDEAAVVYVSNVDAAEDPQHVAALLAHVAPVVALARVGPAAPPGATHCVYRAAFATAAAARAAVLLTACPLGRSTIVVARTPPPPEGPAAHAAAQQAAAAAALWAAARPRTRTQSAAERAATVFVAVRGAVLAAADVRDTLAPCGAVAHCAAAHAAALFVQFRDSAAALAAATYDGTCVRGATLAFAPIPSHTHTPSTHTHTHGTLDRVEPCAVALPSLAGDVETGAPSPPPPPAPAAPAPPRVVTGGYAGMRPPPGQQQQAQGRAPVAVALPPVLPPGRTHAAHRGRSRSRSSTASSSSSSRGSSWSSSSGSEYSPAASLSSWSWSSSSSRSSSSSPHRRRRHHGRRSDSRRRHRSHSRRHSHRHRSSSRTWG